MGHQLRYISAHNASPHGDRMCMTDPYEFPINVSTVQCRQEVTALLLHGVPERRVVLQSEVRGSKRVEPCWVKWHCDARKSSQACPEYSKKSRFVRRVIGQLEDRNTMVKKLQNGMVVKREGCLY